MGSSGNPRSACSRHHSKDDYQRSYQEGRSYREAGGHSAIIIFHCSGVGFHFFPRSSLLLSHDAGGQVHLVTAHPAELHLVLVSGDGFNDSPALAAADVALAMGETGTDMALQSAGLILLTGDFAAIVMAVCEGLRI
jgi:hypothetical protein